MLLPMPTRLRAARALQTKTKADLLDIVNARRVVVFRRSAGYRPPKIGARRSSYEHSHDGVRQAALDHQHGDWIKLLLLSMISARENGLDQVFLIGVLPVWKSGYRSAWTMQQFANLLRADGVSDELDVGEARFRINFSQRYQA
jgi:hypothetical protein